MKIRRTESTEERTALIGMIVRRDVLAQIASKWTEEGLFKNKWCNLIAGWCIHHFERYDDAPKDAIEGMWERWSRKTNDSESADLVGRFLETLSDQYEEQAESANVDYILDVAAAHFHRTQAERLLDDLGDDIAAGQMDQFVQRIGNWSQIELDQRTGIDPLNDMEAVRAAFENSSEPLIKYPGALGEFFEDRLERDGFVAFMGPDKRGKSFWLMDVVYRALLQNRRVAYFEVGDMSQNQVMVRLMARVAGRPRKAETIRVPRRLTRVAGDREAIPEWEERHFDSSLSWRKAWKACRKLVDKRLKTEETRLRLSCHPNTSISVLGVRGILLDWARVGWVPDVVVIDYADLLEASVTAQMRRDAIDDTWKRLRALSQELHCLVVTATQTDSAAYSTRVIQRANFSDCKTKLAHVTGMIGLNQTPEEQEMGLLRLNWVVRREGSYSEMRCLHVAGCPAISRPAIRSCW